ncbi:MAG: RHS repeat protein [Dehalococcoidia bacterium]|nr:RHS repeat protein [Dehalococcoidia bacterium]
MPRRDIGRRTSITYPGGSNQVTYGYDNANRLTSVTDWNSNSTTYSYDDAGRMTSTTLPSGTVAIDTEGCEVGNVGCHERAGGYMGCTWTTPQSCDLAEGIGTGLRHRGSVWLVGRRRAKRDAGDRVQ